MTKKEETEKREEEEEEEEEKCWILFFRTLSREKPGLQMSESKNRKKALMNKYRRRYNQSTQFDEWITAQKNRI